MKIIRQRICRDVMFVKNLRKILIKFSFYFILLFITLLIGLLPNLVDNKQVIHHRARFITDLKYILIWKSHKKKSMHDIASSGQSLFIKQNCPYINCYITHNRSLLRPQEYDAVLFHAHDIKKKKDNNLTMPRSPNQFYIFKSLESAENHIFCNPELDNFFNWTWTYKLDSDIPQPFINVYNKNDKIVAPKIKPNWITDMQNTDAFKNTIYGKNKAVATVISNCNLKIKHKVFLAKLKEELNGYNYSLDTYGPCGESKCGGLGRCNKMIQDEYFFNLVLEESFSPDFVSEKVAKAMMHLAIPIIAGGSNLTDFLPPGSYINAFAFDIKKLGAVLDYLIRDPKKYSLFFDWKSYYYYSVRPKSSVCDLCTKLNERGYERKSYKQFRKWWYSGFEETCEIRRLNELFRS